MKKCYRILSLLLMLCLLVSASSAAGIEEETHTHGIVEVGSSSSGIQEIGAAGTEQETDTSVETPAEDPTSSTTSNTAPSTTAATTEDTPDRMLWNLDADGTLWIGGKGIVIPISSAEQQPWATVRTQIKTVRFCTSSHLLIDSIAYWFSGCVNLEYVELPSYVFAIGDDAFKDCAKLEELILYHSEDAPTITDQAFTCSNGTDLCVTVLSAKTEAACSAANWSGRSVEVIDLSGFSVSLMAVQGPCGISGCYCTSCTYAWRTVQYDEDYHYRYAYCTVCNADEYAYGTRSAHTFNSSGVCTVCGYAQTVACTHGSTYTSWSGCSWYRYCNYCGDLVGSGVSHGTYVYGSWTYYTTSQHRRSYTCSDCGQGSYEYASHSTTNQYVNYSDTQHTVTKYCATCGSTVGSATYASHSYTYGSWSSYSSSQHRRTKGCSDCDLSTYEYGSHADSNSDGVCDTCGYSMTVTVTWDAGTNGGKVNGSNSVTTSVATGSTPTAPSYTPVKTGHSFKGWYTAATGGSLYHTVTVSAARTFYAQFTANTYTITWDLGNGTSETTKQEYGQPLVLPDTELSHDHANFDGWYTEETGGTEVDETTIFEGTSDATYYAHWMEVFSVTVPTTLPLRVDENGQVYSTEAAIYNHSTGSVRISAVTLMGENGWTIVPYDTNMANEKVDAKLVGLSLNQKQTETTGSSETLSLGDGWHIFREDDLTLEYDAVISAMSQPVTNASILSAVFVVEWV